MTSRQKKTLLLTGDIIVLTAALALSLYIRYGAQEFDLKFDLHWPRFIFIFFTFIISLYVNQLYDLNLRVNSGRFFRQTFNTIVSAGLVSILYFYLSISSEISPKTNLAIFIAFFLVLFYLWRLTHQTLSSFRSKNGLAIIGENDKSANLIQELKKNPGAGYKLELIVKSRDDFSELARLTSNNNLKTIVVCDDFGEASTGAFLLSLLPHQINVFGYTEFYEHLTSKIPVESLSTDWFLDNLKEGRRNFFQFVKRVLDLSVAGLIFILSIVFWPIIALIIRSESHGPALFKQTRLGRQGKRFTIYKFRTMRTENNDESLTQKGDSRVTKFGKFLRKSRLDELPQTINIILGDMSFIGPRPERPELAEKLEESVPFYNVRLIVKPGLSGLDQVSGEYHSPSKEDTLKKLQYDLFYIKNRSMYLDSVIALKTIATVFKGYGR